jgi:sulfoxide reductase heme-binding subunit YedZ
MSWKLATVTFAILVATVIAGRAFDSSGGTATWDMARSAAWASYLLLWASVITGVGVNLRFHPGVGRQALVFEVHRMTGTLGLTLALVHGFALVLDRYLTFHLWDVFVPFTSAYRPWEVALGVFALWLLLAILFSTWFAGWVSTSAWRAIHYLSYAAFGLALLHGLTAGSDTQHWPTHVLYSLTVGALLGAVFLRFVAHAWVEAVRHAASHPQP